MIPFRHLDERVWLATHSLRYQHLDESKYVAHVDPEVFMHARREATYAFPRLTPTDEGAWQVLGLKIAVDPRLRRGGVVLRHEVEA